MIIESPPRTLAPHDAASIRPRLSALQPSPPRLLPLAKSPPALAAAQPSGPVRVFIHVTDLAQRPAVDRIRSELSGLNVAVPPVRFVRNAPGRTELRCLKQADCAAASRIAHDLTQALRTPVTLVDMSRTYEHDGAVRPGSLELWVAPGV